MQIRRTAWTVCALLVALAGCQQQDKNVKLGGNVDRKPPAAVTDVNHVAVMLRPPLIDIDGDNTPDGVLVYVYLRHGEDAKPLPAVGDLTIRLMQRSKSPQGRPIDTELKSWKVPPEDMPKALTRDRFGLWCYRMELYWQKTVIPERGAFIIGEFTRPDGQTVRSQSLALAVVTPEG